MTPRRTPVTLGVRISVDQKEDLKVRLSHWSTGCTLMKFSEADLHVWVLDQVPLGLSCPGLSPDSRWVRGEQRGWESWAHLRVCYPCFLLCQNSANELSKQALTNTFSSAHRCWRKRKAFKPENVELTYILVIWFTDTTAVTQRRHVHSSQL